LAGFAWAKACGFPAHKMKKTETIKTTSPTQIFFLSIAPSFFYCLGNKKKLELLIRRLRRLRREHQNIKTSDQNSFTALKAQINFPEHPEFSLTLHPC
jgi:hypothetical protein